MKPKNKQIMNNLTPKRKKEENTEQGRKNFGFKIPAQPSTARAGSLLNMTLHEAVEFFLQTLIAKTSSIHTYISYKKTCISKEKSVICILDTLPCCHGVLYKGLGPGSHVKERSHGGQIFKIPFIFVKVALIRFLLLCRF